MGTIHKLVIEHGRQAALKKVAPAEQHLVRIAADILAEEDDAIGVTYSGFCQASLPHKKLPNSKEWIRQSERLTLMIEPGRLVRPGTAEGEFVGVPYGSRARLILLYLQTQALRSRSREVELGRSMREWLRRMGIAQGGKSIREVRDQAMRLSICKLTFFYQNADGGTGFSSERIVDDGVLFLEPLTLDDRQERLFVETVRLSQSFYDALSRHPIPLWEPAIRAIQNNSMGLDLYVWLAYRLHVLPKPIVIRWPRLHQQFGAGFRTMRQFKPTFTANLKLAMAVYPDAAVELEDDGVRLSPSRPPVPERQPGALERAGGVGRVPALPPILGLPARISPKA
jgi:replication initiator protein